MDFILFIGKRLDRIKGIFLYKFTIAWRLLFTRVALLDSIIEEDLIH